MYKHPVLLLLIADIFKMEHFIQVLQLANQKTLEVISLSDMTAGIAFLKKEQVDIVVLDISLEINNRLQYLTTLSPYSFFVLYNSHIPAETGWFHNLFQTIQASRISNKPIDAQSQRVTLPNKLAQQTLNSISRAIIITDVSNTITYLNKGARELTGWMENSALGCPLTDILKLSKPTGQSCINRPKTVPIISHHKVEGNRHYWLLRHDGSELEVEIMSDPVYCHAGNLLGTVTSLHDISHIRAEIQSISHCIYHDSLTDLPNRALLIEQMEQVITLAKRHKQQASLLFLDLDHFKEINDTFGHAVGDQLLVTVANKLKDCVRASDTVFRQGGDEFVVLLAEIAHSSDAIYVAKKILQAFSVPCLVADRSIYITLSIGISVFPSDAQSSDMLLLHADSAMYGAKSKGRNHYQIYR